MSNFRYIELSVYRKNELPIRRNVELSIYRKNKLPIYRNIELSIYRNDEFLISRNIEILIHRTNELPIYRNIEVSVYRIERVFPSITWHPRERKHVGMHACTFSFPSIVFLCTNANECPVWYYHIIPGYIIHIKHDSWYS